MCYLWCLRSSNDDIYKELLYTEEKETQRLSSNGKMEDMDEQIPQKVSKRKKDKGKRKKEKLLEETISSEVRKSSDGECDAEEPEFWIPPLGERWDLDDGGDRWGSDSESELESDEIDGTGNICIYELVFLYALFDIVGIFMFLVNVIWLKIVPNGWHYHIN